MEDRTGSARLGRWRGESASGDNHQEGKALSDDIRDLEETEEFERDEVEGHISKIEMNSEADDDFEAHIKLD